MSSVNAPQPDASGPAEVFDSTASAPHGPVVSSIGQPAGPPQETPSHTGMSNTFDVKLHMQYVPIDVITWSVAQSAGTLLWKRPIHPRYCHEAMNVLSTIYNCWSGGLDFNFKIAGTGFHAGAIAIVRIPPNFSPEDFTTPSSWGLFEYVVIDPKTLEVESLSVIDQRRIMYHYMEFDQKNPNTFGGWLAMYVLVALNTSSTGSQQIQVQSFTRPSPSFQFSQLVMPGRAGTPPQFPLCFSEYFDFGENEILTTFPAVANTIRIESKDISSTQAVMNCFTMDGLVMSKFCNKDDKYSLDEKDMKALMSSGDGIRPGEDRTHFDFIKIIKPLGMPVKGKKAWYVNLEQEDQFEQFSNGDIEWQTDVATKTVTIVHKVKADKLKTANAFAFITTSAIMPDKYNDNAYAAAAKGESIVYFESRGDDPKQWDVLGIQIRKLTELFKSARLADILPSGMCLLFIMEDKTEGNLPLGYVKLYKEGFFTARASTEVTYFDLHKIRFVFSSYILRTEPIPTNVSYNSNQLLVGYRPGFQLRQRKFQ